MPVRPRATDRDRALIEVLHTARTHSRVFTSHFMRVNVGTSGKTGFHYGFHDGAPDGAFLHVTVSFLNLFEFQLQISNPGINYHLDNRKNYQKDLHLPKSIY